MPTTTARKAALALHIGVNRVDPKQYAGWDGPLLACENDARDMATISRAQGAKPTVLLTPKATRAAVIKGLRAAAKALKAGDLFFLTFSGHGGQVRDSNGDEPDKKDETWCLYDGQLIDDELYFELAQFKDGVRILVLSDSCHSGSVTRDAIEAVPPGFRAKILPPPIADRVYREHAAFYDALQDDVKAKSGGKVVDPDAMLAQVAVSGPMGAMVGRFKAVSILISGCQDNQVSLDGEHNGAFTEALLKVWDGGAFKGNYLNFHARIRSRLPGSQSPNLFTLGKVGSFLAERPFTV